MTQELEKTMIEECFGWSQATAAQVPGCGPVQYNMLTAGTPVSAFYRASGVVSNGDARWMASPTPADSRSPHIGVTAGWHFAIV